MKNYIYSLLNTAKKNNDISQLKALYDGNPSNYQIKFEYAKLLIRKGNVELARKLLFELLDTPNRGYALFELGKLEEKNKNIELAVRYFSEILSSNNIEKKDIDYAMLELGRIEARYGDINKAREYFSELLKSSVKSAATLELGRLEIIDGNIDLGKSYIYSLIKTDSKNKEYAFALLMVVLIKNKEYEKAVELIEKYDLDFLRNQIYLILSKELNIYFDGIPKGNKYSYSINQMLDYDEYVAIDHIVSGHVNGINKATFNPDVDVYKLFNEIQKDLTEENKLNELVLNDIYVVYYPNVGIDGENYIRIITTNNTKNILSMYPIKNIKDIVEEEMEDVFVSKTKKINNNKKTIKR